MSDYNGKVYRKQGGDELVVASGGVVTVESGGELVIDGGGTVTGLATYTIQPAITSLTDNGGGTADGTVASLAAATTLTDNTGLSGSHNDTLAAVTTFTPSVAWNGSDVFPSAADATAIATAITVLNQNASDTAQKVIELVAWQAVVQDAFKEVTTKIEEILDSLRTGGAIET